MPPEPDLAETEALRRFLAERDVACPRCGYNLRGLNVGRCPECGLELTTHAELAPSLFGPVLAAAMGVGTGAGMSVLGLAIVVSHGLIDGQWPNKLWEYMVCWVIPASALLMLGGLLMFFVSPGGKRWMRRRRHWERRAAIIASWLSTCAWMWVWMFAFFKHF